MAEAVEKMGLRYAVVTSVNRDDWPDGGAAIFARTIQEIRRRVPDCRVEVLIPDFRGVWTALDTVLAARPNVLNHNMETVPRLYRRVRRGAEWERSLELLRRVRQSSPDTPTKTGMMLGLGETREEVLAAMEEIAAQGTHILTLGQYLQPTREHLPVEPALFIPMNLPNSSAWASRWDLSTWKRDRSFDPPITPSNRKNPPETDLRKSTNNSRISRRG